MNRKKVYPSGVRLRRVITLALCFVAAVANTTFVRANDDDKGGALARPVARLVTTLRTPGARRPAPAATSPRATANRVATSRAALSATATSAEKRAFDLLNAARRAKNLPPLQWDAELNYLARAHSSDMARSGVLNHKGSDGLDTAARARSLGVTGWRALGENIAYNQGFDDPVALAVERWMQSTKHRTNILHNGFTHTGLGIAQAADGSVYFTQVFVAR